MIGLINSYIPDFIIDDQLKKELILRSRLLNVRQGHTFLHPEQSLENVYFIKEGVVRSSYVKNEIEFTNWFYSKGEIMFAAESFYIEKRSGFLWEAAWESQVIEIKKKTSCI